MSFLDLIEVCDNFKLNQQPQRPASFCLKYPDGPVVGLLAPKVVEALKEDNTARKAENLPPRWEVLELTSSDNTVRYDQGYQPRIFFTRAFDTQEKRSQAMEELGEDWQDSGKFPELIGPGKWRDELYPVYKNPFGKLDDEDNIAFHLERSMAGLFGVVTYGVHMTVYRNVGTNVNPSLDDVKIWVPQRAKTKSTWAGYFDNSVAGGISDGMGIFATLVKESMEEASLPETIVNQYAKATGAVSYFYQRPEGWLQPEIEYTYDLCLPPDVDFTPKPSDGEVEGFEFISLREVVRRMHLKQFKPNTALVLLDFMIRHGIIAADDEPNYMEILTRLHGRFDFGQW